MKRALTAICILSLLASSSATASESPTRSSSRFIRAEHRAPGNVHIVVLDRSLAPRDVPRIAAELATLYGGTLRRVMTDAANAFSLEIEEQNAIALSNAAGVLLVEENGLWELSSATNEWHLDRIDQTSGTDGQYNACYTGLGVTAYVVDSGVAAAHSEFRIGATGTKVLDGVNFSNDSHSSINPCGGFTNNESDVPRTYNSGHGTSVASLIAGNTVGVSPDATIVSVKIADCTEDGPTIVTEDVAWGLDWIRSTNNPYRARRPALVNMSFFRYVEDDDKVGAMEHVINGLVLTDYDLASGRPEWEGIPAIASANNQDGSACNYSPSRMAWSNPGDDTWSSPGHVISVAGTRKSDIRWDCVHHPGGDQCDTISAPGSNFGLCADIYAPAHDITSASLRDANAYRELYEGRSGTSFSSAIVSGVVAQYLEKSPSFTPEDVWNSIKNRAITLTNDEDPHGIGSINFVQLPLCPKEIP